MSAIAQETSRETREIGTMLEDAFAWMERCADKRQMILLGARCDSSAYLDAVGYLQVLMDDARLRYTVKIIPGVKHVFTVEQDEMAVCAVPPSNNYNRWRGYSADRLSMWNLDDAARSVLSLAVLPTNGVVVRYGP